MPTSKELLEMADREWKNREERKGIHDKVSWTSGWISGYLTHNPQAERDTIPRMSKEYIEERNRLIRKDEREKVLKDIEQKLIEACSENYEPSGMGCKCCPFLIVYDEGLECVLAELRGKS
jgi:hypothetical protein